MRALAVLATTLLALTGTHAARAAEPTLVITQDGKRQDFTASALLARPDAATVNVPNDVSYGKAMSYRAVPLLSLLGKLDDARFDTLEARATDGFTAQIPLSLVARGAAGGSVAWVAVEDPAKPWPPLSHAPSAGPFYLVWANPERSGVRGEQWPYAMASLTFTESPVHRWPQLALPDGLPADAAPRTGQTVFLTLCFPCHRLNGAGAGEMGPDLGQPMNAVRYLTDAGLRAIVRDPRAVRTWPEQRMEGFDQKTLSDADLDALIAYLHAVADKTASAK
ncbi:MULTISPECIES: cytochrome c [Rhodomicrobium]|uniref:c-type cytochrome n=1 Tax=Rhodomicrobium TaxID=1068 RepID=UPI000B4AB23A|nr:MULTISPECIES: cytochrome c [Rhodomicrobium]